MTELYTNFPHVIVFLHVISAVVWVGGMIAIRFAVHPSLQSIDNAKIKLGKTLQIVGKLFNIVMPFIFISLITALIMLKGLALTGAMVHVKETIWTIMTLNYIYMYIKRLKAQKLFDNDNLADAKSNVALFPNILLPINIILGISAIYIGATLRF